MYLSDKEARVCDNCYETLVVCKYILTTIPISNEVLLQMKDYTIRGASEVGESGIVVPRHAPLCVYGRAALKMHIIFMCFFFRQLTWFK